MDPFSLCANVITVLQATYDIISICYDFRAALKQSPWGLTRVLDNVTDLRTILERLERLASEEEDLPQKSSSRRKNLELLSAPNSGPLACCRRELDRLSKILSPSSLAGAQGTKRHAFIRALGWRIKNQDIKVCLERLEKCKSTLSLALTADEATLLLHIQDLTLSLDQGVESLNAKVSDIAAAMELKEFVELDERRRQILQWLCPVDPADSHDTALRSHIPGTGEWFLYNYDFVQWCKDGSSLLWLTGPPGAGKTILLSTAIRNLAQKQHSSSTDLLLAYFYCDFRNKERRDAVNVAGSLVAQLCQQTEQFPIEIESAFDNRDSAGQRSRPNLDILDSCLKFFGREYKVVICVDALDECDQRARLAQFFCQSIDPHTMISVLVTSRNELDLQENFTSFSRVQLELHKSQMEADIQLYTDSRLGSDRRLSQLNISVKSDIATSLQTKSSGMFRWVQCQLDSISTLQTVKAIRMALNELPVGLDETYGRILRKVSHRDAEFVRKILLWLSFSILPLKLEEVHEAIAIEQDIDDLDEDNKLSDPQDILALCQSLVVLSDQGYVTLAHLSVRDYLMSGKIQDDDRLSVYAMSGNAANLELANDCVTYLNFKVFDDGPSPSAEDYALRLHRYPLLKHAAIAWAYYYIRVRSPSQALHDKVLQFFGLTSRNTFMSWIQILTGDYVFKWNLYAPFATSLYYASSFGLSDIVQELVDQGADLNAPGSRFGGTSLHGATLREHTEVMTILLRAGADPNKADFNGVHPLHTAAGRGFNEGIKILLAHGANYNVKDSGGETPADWAHQSGQAGLSMLIADEYEQMEKREADLVNAASKQPVQVWTRQRTYFPGFYAKRSGMDSSIVVNVEIGPTPSTSIQSTSGVRDSSSEMKPET